MTSDKLKEVRVLHVITGLGIGGTETALLRLLQGLKNSDIRSIVVSLSGHGPLSEKFRKIGVTVLAPTTTRSGRIRILSYLRILRELRGFRPLKVQGWMYHGNLVASVLSQLWWRRAQTVWNIRCSLDGIGLEKRATRILIRIEGLLSNEPKAIVYNSRTSAKQHQKIGFSESKTLVIPNGFDLSRFRPDPSSRNSTRRTLELDTHTTLIGVLGRYHPIKGYPTFFAAAGKLIKNRAPVHFILAGSGMDDSNTELAAMIEAQGIVGRTTLLGELDDIAPLLAALDLLVSPSFGEAFPNIVGEAMACGVPCIGTDVGDTRFLIGNAGRIVRPGDSSGLFREIQSFIDLPESARALLATSARERINTSFTQSRTTRSYLSLYRES
ncbi:glycosyltransferase [bacterium]|nr:glycosyltransferase [bacterium]